MKQWTPHSVLKIFSHSAVRHFFTSPWRPQGQNHYDEVMEGEEGTLKTECELMANRYFHVAASGHQLLLIQPHALKAPSRSKSTNKCVYGLKCPKSFG
jgi:hypothetical protein